MSVLGPWNKGYAFDVHSTGSVYKGENELGIQYLTRQEVQWGNVCMSLNLGKNSQR
jgi:hypothetical protein